MEVIRVSLVVMLCLGLQRSLAEILQRQKRNWIIDSYSIDEGYDRDFPYRLGKIDVEKEFALFKIHGQGVDEEPKGVLEIDEQTGEITVHQPVDYEKHQVLKLVFQALDKDNHVTDTRLGIEIQILDSNDNPPKFDHERYEVSIKESTMQGTHVITVKASDADATDDNKMFDFRIVSVTPTPHDLEFYVIQVKGTQTGVISFKGCLDHETAETYTIIVEAKDHGKKKQLSSSCTVIINIEDGNNHLPEITGQTGSGRVKEREEGVLVSRLHVTDHDSKGTPAWKAKYQIQGDTNNSFIITTEAETNDGLLYVEKHLDYEDRSEMTLSITVENEIPYSSCQVVSRKATGLWEVVIVSAAGSGTGVTGGQKLVMSTYQVTVFVEDVNEPPIFDESSKRVTLTENVEPGQYLETFTARDPDINSANTFIYTKGEDPADWISVDPVTGKITTTKAPDRESPFVKDSIYQVTIYAVDDGKPPMTGTATLSIYVNNENDNAPTLSVSSIDMCQSDGPSAANISAVDLDGEPYAGPFNFQLLGDVEGKWSVKPRQGYSVNLVKDSTVYPGEFKLLLRVSDSQDNAAVHNLSVTVCNCQDTAMPDCSVQRSASAVGSRALGAIFFGILLLAGMLLLLLLVSCKKETIKMPDEGLGQHLMKCNSEIPGTDCKVAFEQLKPGKCQIVQEIQVPSMPSNMITDTRGGMSCVDINRGNFRSGMITDTVDEGLSQNSCVDINRGNFMRWSVSGSSARKSLHGMTANSVDEGLIQNRSCVDFNRGNFMRWSSSAMRASSTLRTRHQEGKSLDRMRLKGGKYFTGYQGNFHDQILFQVLNKTLHKLQARGAELGDYAPHVYADEGDAEIRYQLDAISIPDISFDPDLDLDVKFRPLASVCMPSESTTYSTQASSAMENHETVTLIQTESRESNINTLPHFYNMPTYIYDKDMNTTL